MRTLFVLALTLAVAGGAAADTPKKPAIEILERAIANQKSKASLASALAELDALIAKDPKNADAHYARGWVLSRTSKNEDAVAAYDRAFELDPTLADAPYNAGVVLGRMGNSKEAVIRFERTLKVDKKHVDAAYNAGQSYYDLDDYTKAAARWETATKLSPDDFQIAKKLVQAYVALNQPAKVKAARARVFAMWKAGKSTDKNYVYDQFNAAKYRVFVYETFDTAGDLAYVYQAKVTLGGKSLGSINLETSAVIREQGTPYIVGIDKDGEHSTLAQHAFKKLPEYSAFKTLVQKLVGEKF